MVGCKLQQYGGGHLLDMWHNRSVGSASIEYLPIAGCVLVAGGLMLWYTGNSSILVQVVYLLAC